MMIEALENYTAAQKTVGTRFIFIGIILLIIAIVIWFGVEKTNFYDGLKTGSFICGIIILLGGAAYYNFSQTTHKKIVDIHSESKTEYLTTEKLRMTKVAKDYPIYQLVFSGFIVASLVIIFLLNQAFWSGVACAVILQFIGVLIVEYISKTSIDSYNAFLSTF